MTKKDYIVIAEAIKRERDMQSINAVRAIADSIASALAVNNSRFDSARFITACGL